MKRPEQAFQQQVAQYLALSLGGTAWFSAIPLGGGGRLRGAILKGMGVKSGIPDIFIVDGGRVFGLELKAPKGTVSEAQERSHSDLRRAGCPVAVCKSIAEVAIFLERHGIAVKARLA
jgi:hypothetical protein